MRRYVLTVSILGLLFSSCAEAPQKVGGVLNSPDLTPASTLAAQQGAPDQFRRNIVTEMFFSENAYDRKVPLSERFQGLDPREISKAEIDELIDLEKQQKESLLAFRMAQQAWARQDPANRGAEPIYRAIPQAERLQALWYKAALAEIGKKYGNFDSRVLSKADAEEIIALEQERAASEMEHQTKLTAWYKQDSATRGPRPGRHRAMQANNNPRLKALRDKFGVAKNIQQEMDRIVQLSQTHNLPILDNELSELIRLHTEKIKLDTEMNKIMTNALVQGQLKPQLIIAAGGEIDGAIIEKLLPRDLLERMFVIGQHIDAIQAPFEAAEKAAKVLGEMTKLSEASGVPISSGDIADAIALNAEKDRIEKRTQVEAATKWMAEGGPVSAVQTPLPTGEDLARLKEINARLKAISAPMVVTK